MYRKDMLEHFLRFLHLTMQALGRRSWRRWQPMLCAATCLTGWRHSRWRRCVQHAWPSAERHKQRWVTAASFWTQAPLETAAVRTVLGHPRALTPAEGRTCSQYMLMPLASPYLDKSR